MLFQTLIPVEENGRTVFLLKQKAKPTLNIKKRRKVPLYGAAAADEPMGAEYTEQVNLTMPNGKKKIIPGQAPDKGQ